MTRNSFPIEQCGVKDPINTGIVFGNLTFPLWEAAVAAGATLDELERLEEGRYSKRFSVRLLAWHEMHKLVELHTEDAKAKAMEKRAKKARKK